MTEHVSEPPTDTIVVPIWLDEGAYRRLQHLADAMSRTRGGFASVFGDDALAGVFSVERILDELIDHRAYEAMYAAGDEPR